MKVQIDNLLGRNAFHNYAYSAILPKTICITSVISNICGCNKVNINAIEALHPLRS